MRQALQAAVEVATIAHVVQTNTPSSSYRHLLLEEIEGQLFVLKCLFTPQLVELPVRLLTAFCAVKDGLAGAAVGGGNLPTHKAVAPVLTAIVEQMRRAASFLARASQT